MRAEKQTTSWHHSAAETGHRKSERYGTLTEMEILNKVMPQHNFPRSLYFSFQVAYNFLYNLNSILHVVCILISVQPVF
jgi:hypothetical protein